MEYISEKRNLSEEPVGNWKSKDYYMPVVTVGGEGDMSTFRASLKRGSIANSVRASIFSKDNIVIRNLVTTAERPTEIHNIHDVQLNEYKNQISCFL
jgi:hypothetical protein